MDRAFDALAAGTSRRIIEETLTEPLTAQELVERCDRSRSAVYRKLRRLVNPGFVAGSRRIRTDRKDAMQFETAVDAVRVRFSERDSIELAFATDDEV